MALDKKEENPSPVETQSKKIPVPQTLDEAMLLIGKLQDTVAGYQGTRQQDRQQIDQLRSEMEQLTTQHKETLTTLGTVMEQLPGLAEAAKGYKRMTALAPYGDLLADETMRKLVMSSSLGDEELATLLGDLSYGFEEDELEDEKVASPEVLAPQEPEVPLPPAEPRQPEQPIMGPPPTGTTFGKGITAEGVLGDIRAALDSGNFDDVMGLSETFAQLKGGQ